MSAPLDDWLNPTVQAALVAATVAVGGWVYNGRQNRRLATQLRGERVDDIQRAVLAEIRAHVVALENQQLSPDEQQDLTRRVRQGGYIPALPTEANDRIFRAITAEVHLLPARVIDPVVIYYRLLAIMSSLAGDLRLMAAQDPARAADMFEDYLSLTDETLYSGRYAMVILSARLDGGDEAVDALLEEAADDEAAQIAASLPQELEELRTRLNRRSSDRSDL